MEPARTPELFPRLYSLPFFLAGILSVVMLATDKNLQTGFGSVTSGYYSHWYGVLAIALANFAGGVFLILRPSRRGVKLGVIGSGLLTAALLGVVLTYMQVGFASAGDFANYLFGVTYYGGNLRYLYDALLGVQLATSVGGGVGLWLTRGAPEKASASADQQKTAA